MSTISKLCFVALTISLAGWSGCAKKEEKKGEPTPVTETVDAGETASSDADSTETALPIEEKKEAAPLSPAEERRAKLRSSFLELNCLRKSSGPEASLEVYKKAGFADAAAWSTAWHEEAEKNVEWASKIIEEAVEKGCKVKLEAPLD